MDAPTPAMVAAAARWAAELDGGQVSDARRRACEDWCARDPRHRLVLERMLGLDGRLDRLDGAGRRVLRRTLARTRAARRRAVGASALALVLVAAGWAGGRSMALREPFADYPSRTEVAHLTLADGSRLDLDAGSVADVEQGPRRRRVTLYRGEALVHVTPGAPFVVETRHGRATALGTAYLVRDEGASTLVAVTESTVRVCPPRTDEGCEILKAGERARVGGRRVTRLAPVDPSSVGGWASGWLEVDDRPVVQVLAELNRYRVRPIVFDAGALDGARVTGAYRLAETDRAAESIAQAAGLRVAREPDGTLRLIR